MQQNQLINSSPRGGEEGASRKIIGIGETVLDIIFKNNKPIESVPGGSTFNCLISLGRCGLPCTFISETGNDRIGDVIINFLKDNNVNADNVHVYPESKSPVSLAFLDEHNNAEYIFYKDHPNDKLDFVYPDIQPDDIVVFGSFFAVNPVIRQQVLGLLDLAKERGAIIYYDVNYRPSHRNEVIKIKPYLLENLEYCDFVRGSKEDFDVLYRQTNPDRVYRSEISFYCRRFIFTDGGNPVVTYDRDGYRKEYPAIPAKIVSTIGAGDNFNAGFIYGLIKYNITRETLANGLTPDQWNNIIACAQEFSAECCKDIYNYVSKDFGNKLMLNV